MRPVGREPGAQRGFRCGPCVLAILLLLGFPPISAHAAMPEPVLLERETRHEPLGSRVAWWVEEGGRRSIDEVRLPEIAGRFRPAGPGVLTFGFRDEAVWLHFRVHNPTDQVGHGVVSLDYPILDLVETWVGQGKQLTHLALGDTLPFDQRPLKVLDHALPITVPPGATVGVYLRVTSKTSLTLPLFISSERGFAEAVYRGQWSLGLFYGILVAMAVYAAVFFLITRQRILAFYVAFVVSITMVAATLDGLGFPLWGDWLDFQQVAQYFFIHVAALGTLMFTREFVRPGSARFLAGCERLLIGLHLAGMLAVLFLDPRTAGKLSLSLLLFTVFFVYTGAAWRWRHDRYQPAAIYMAAFFPTILLFVLNVLVVGGVIQSEYLPAYLYRFGMVLQVLLIAAIQGQRMTSLQRERSHLREIAIQSEAEYKARSEFMARISHEIRTPMNGILGMVDLMRDTQLENRQRQYLDVVHNSGVALQGIINDLLDFSKIEAGQLELDPVDFSPDEVVSDALSIFILQCERKGLEVSVAVDPAVPATLHGDNLRLRQVLVNLVGNAYKFTEQGGVSVRVSLAPQEGDARDWLRFEVADTGIGIPEAVIGRLFQSFSQADASTTRRYGGTGLGLAICRQLCELMGGRIWVDSQSGEGSVFTFLLPFAPAQEEREVRGQHDRLFQHLRLLLFEPRQQLGGLLASEVEQIGGTLEHVADRRALRARLQAAPAEAGAPFDYVALSSLPGEADIVTFARDLVSEKLVDAGRLLLFTDIDEHFSDEALSRAGVLAAVPRPFSRYQLGRVLEQLREREGVCAEALDDKACFLRDRGLRILVAEDNPVNQMVIKAFLRKLSLEADIAENGNEVMERVRAAHEPYHLVLMDCVMPEVDGFEAARLLRQHERQTGAGRATIIATTAHVAPEELNRVMSSGMDDCLSKPFDLQQLTDRLFYWVSRVTGEGRELIPAPEEDVARG